MTTRRQKLQFGWAAIATVTSVVLAITQFAGLKSCSDLMPRAEAMQVHQELRAADKEALQYLHEIDGNVKVLLDRTDGGGQ